MGIEYYIVDTSKKTFFDLGKGGWYELSDGLEYLTDKELLALHITDLVFGLDNNDEDYIDFSKYVNDRLAPDLIQCFGNSNIKDLRIVNDCGDDLCIMRAKNYRCVGTRYYDQQAEIMGHHNKHLNPTHRLDYYNPMDYDKYPEWEKY